MSRQLIIDITTAFQRDFELLVENEEKRLGFPHTPPSVAGVNAMFAAWSSQIQTVFGCGIEKWRAIDQPLRARDHPVALMAILEHIYARNKKLLETL